jgi:hypothetical protein
MEISCEYIESTVADSRKGVVLKLVVLTGANKSVANKTASII